MAGLTQQLFMVVSDALMSPITDIAADFTRRFNITKILSNEAASSGHSENAGAIAVSHGIASTLAIFIVFLVYIFSRQVYKILFVPLDRVRRLGSIGYLNHEAGELSRRELSNLLQQRRKIGEDIPPVYPNGWFRLIDSVQLRMKEVKQVHALGQNFAVFRGESGKVTVMDAYCAHMGGNLAVAGRVRGDCLECPFHGWTYNAEGKCIKIPYAKKVPDFANTKMWTSLEVNGVVFVWYHCDNVDPQWEIPTITEIRNGTFYYRGRTEHHANTHVQDIPENGSDLAHLSHLHVPNVFCGVDLAKQFDSWFNFADHIFRVKCKEQDAARPHVSKFDITHHIALFKKYDMMKFLINAEQIGPGIVHLHMKFPFGNAVLVQTLTPVAPLRQILIHSFYTDWKIPTWLAKIILTFDAIQVDRDVMVWNNKTFCANPLLVKEDGQITKFRRWFSQFYSKNSPRLKLKDDDNFNW